MKSILPFLSVVRRATLMGAVVGGLGFASTQAQAATFVVTSTADTEGDSCGVDCTLRQAIHAANKDQDYDSIVFDSVVFASKQTIEVTREFGPVKSDISITGPNAPGSGVTLRQPGNANGGGGRLFDVIGGTLALANLNLTGAGMALFLSGGNATVTGCTFYGNKTAIMNASTGHTRRPDEVVETRPKSMYPDFVLEAFTTVTANNCTICDNEYGVTNLTGFVKLNSCTITGNKYGVAGGDGSQTLVNCLVVGNSIGNTAAYGHVETVFNKDTSNILTGTAAASGLDPRGLQDNGGPTQTIALIKGSAAINAGKVTDALDQRGIARPTAGSCDVGAFQTLPGKDS